MVTPASTSVVAAPDPVDGSATASGSSGPTPRPPGARLSPPRLSGPPLVAPARAGSRNRRTKLAVRKLDAWSVFLFTLLWSIFLGIALVVAVLVLYTLLERLEVIQSANTLYAEIRREGASTEPLLSSRRLLVGAGVVAAVNVVLLTLLSTLGALLYNACASFTGGIEVTLAERDG